MTSQGFLRGFLVTGLALAAAVPHQATAQLMDIRNNCTTTNCKAQTIQAQYRLDHNNRATPFEAEIFSSGGECVRVAVTKEATDLETVLVAPNGTFWRNDDGALSCGLCPVVKAITPQAGWYTLQISQFGAGGAMSNFTFNYGRYPSGNPNCNNPTPPVAPEPVSPKSQ